MSKSLMLVSQSNSGSTWFSKCLTNTSPHLIGPDKEYFNPVLQNKHRRRMSVFGAEHYPFVLNLAKRQKNWDMDKLLRETWRKDGLNYTKENYLAFVLPRLREHFDFVFFFRDMQWCFPPERVRVMLWYDAWLCSLLANGEVSSGLLQWMDTENATMERRAVAGWQIVRWQLMVMSKALDAPVFKYADILSQPYSDLLKSCSRLTNFGIDARKLADEIESTRKNPPRPSVTYLDQWEDALDFHAGMVEKFEEEQMSYLQERHYFL